MRCFVRSPIAAAAVAACLVAAATGGAGEPAPAGWQLTWSDEFDGPTIDRRKWDFDQGNGFYSYDARQWIAGWGNGELQYYTREPDNAFVRDGMLHIRALKESLHGCGYTSARLKTRARDGTPLFCQTYGRFEFRAKLPVGQGIWPALWLLPQEEHYGAWAASGEIDVLEARGQQPDRVSGALHFGGRWPANTHTSHESRLPEGDSIAEFHVYALEWEPGRMRWYVDGRPTGTQSFWWSSSRTEKGQGLPPRGEGDLNAWPAPFDRPFYLVLNVAVGGGFVGDPDAGTPFPAEMLVDYVRVYRRQGGDGPPAPRGAGKLPPGTP